MLETAFVCCRRSPNGKDVFNLSSIGIVSKELTVTSSGIIVTEFPSPAEDHGLGLNIYMCHAGDRISKAQHPLQKSVLTEGMHCCSPTPSSHSFA